MHFSLSTSPKHKKEYSSDSSEKKYNLLHFRRISVLIELILAGKAKLSMASCFLYKFHIGEAFMIHVDLHSKVFLQSNKR